MAQVSQQNTSQAQIFIRQEVLRWFYVGAIDCGVRDRQVLETPKENKHEEESISAFLRTDESRADSVWLDVRGGQRKMQLKDSLSRGKKRKKNPKHHYQRTARTMVSKNLREVTAPRPFQERIATCRYYGVVLLLIDLTVLATSRPLPNLDLL